MRKHHKSDKCQTLSASQTPRWRAAQIRAVCVKQLCAAYAFAVDVPSARQAAKMKSENVTFKSPTDTTTKRT